MLVHQSQHAIGVRDLRNLAARRRILLRQPPDLNHLARLMVGSGLNGQRAVDAGGVTSVGDHDRPVGRRASCDQDAAARDSKRPPCRREYQDKKGQENATTSAGVASKKLHGIALAVMM